MPDAMEATLGVLGTMGDTGRRIAVLGSMLELGDYTEEGHRRAGRAAAEYADVLYAYGPSADAIARGAEEKGMQAVHAFTDQNELVEKLRADAKPGDALLFKGSRGMRRVGALTVFREEVGIVNVAGIYPLHDRVVITAAIGPSVIRYLRKMKFGQKILEIGPRWHMNKQNIPTMGGFMFIIGIALAVILGGLITGTLSVHALAILGLSAAYGAVGLVDDYAKIKKKENAGLTPRQKLVLQILVAAVFILVLFLESDGLPSLMIPFTGISIDLPWPVYIIFAAFVIVGADNAVNLTDGIDGLAASVTVPVAVFFAAVGARIGNTGVTIFAGALAGGLLGFLIYNFNPAKVFMGDTGSLFLGGAVAGMAFACDMPLILLLVGLIYIIETLSVILQVTYFKATHGKRLFKMAPIHHHFEMCGWGEKRIVLTFTAVTIVLCLAAYFVALP